ncbi:hypothetical protein MLD38_002949 [Melastoma candidum]|uniref:Uncharacterized protein n=1 Tax=Melastoma candidum TaxID=119954 RepID=A0ACB9S188_9MYRT|nr:hypothetical protein MLD38_002949 [Melastoma candidum]
MPYCLVEEGEGDGGVRLFYRTHGRGPVKVLLIVGLAGTLESWGPQIQGLTGTDMPNDVEFGDGVIPCYEEGVEVCTFDNRGAGRSSVPVDKSGYSTRIMAKDAISLMDHLGWRKAHVFGHSMGGMIACKLATMVPSRVSSLALLNVTGGGFECFPKFDMRTISIMFRFFRAKTPEKRAAVDLDTHYSKEYLDGAVGSTARREILHQEYVKGLSESGLQSEYGFWGQANACWTHKLTRKEIELIRSAGFPVSIIHGRQDVVAQISHARNLAKKLKPAARMIELHGGHLVSHERLDEVNKALWQLIRESELSSRSVSRPSSTKRSYGYMETGMSIQKATVGKEISIPLMDTILDRLNLCMWYFFGWFMLAVEHGRRLIGGPTAIKVANTPFM